MVKIGKVKGAKYVTLVDAKRETHVYIGMCFEDLKEGDLVVCEDAFCDGLTIKKVVTANCCEAMIDNIDYVIIGRVDTQHYDAYRKRQKAKQELQMEMVRRARKFTPEERWDAMVMLDPELAEMWKKYKALED